MDDKFLASAVARMKTEVRAAPPVPAPASTPAPAAAPASAATASKSGVVGERAPGVVGDRGGAASAGLVGLCKRLNSFVPPIVFKYS